MNRPVLAALLALAPVAAHAPDAPPPEIPVLDDLDMWMEAHHAR